MAGLASPRSVFSDFEATEGGGKSYSDIDLQVYLLADDNNKHRAPSMCSESRLHPGPAALPVASEIHPSFVAQLPAAAVAVIMSAVSAVTYGNLVFQAPCFHGVVVPSGVIMWLLGTASAQFAVSAMSHLKFGMGLPTVEMLPIVHALCTSIAASMPNTSGPDEFIGTCLITLFLATCSLAALLISAGSFGFSKYLRMVPLVVLKGALFGVAIFLLQSAVQMTRVTKADSLLDDLSHWGVTVMLGTILFLIDEFLHAPTIVAAFFIIVAITPQVVCFSGLASIEELRANEWLFPSRTSGAGSGLWYKELGNMFMTVVPKAHWDVVLHHIPAMCGMWVTHILCTLMDLKAIELLTQTDVDIDAELRAIGMGNMVSAMSGSCWPVYMICSSNVTTYKLGGRTRAVGLVVLATLVPLLFIIGDVVPKLPKALPGCASWWLGILFMKDTMIDIVQRNTHKLDVAVVASMAVVVVFVGFLEGLMFGCLLAVGIFAMQYSRSRAVIRAISDAHFFRSNVSRSLAEHAVVERLGHRIAVIHVEGYLMFGSSPQLVDAVQRLLKVQGTDWIVVSFRGVRGLDYSAALDLVTLGRQAGTHGKHIVLTELRGSVPGALRDTGVNIPSNPDHIDPNLPEGLCHIAHYNPALQCCENALIRAAGVTGPFSSHNLNSDPATAVLAQTFGDYLDEDSELLQTLQQYFETTEYQPGTVVWHAGSNATFFVGVVHGCIHSLHTPTSGNADDAFIVEVVQRGAFIGYMSVLNHIPYVHTAVVAETSCPCVCLSLRLDTFTALTKEQPKLGMAVLRGLLRRSAYEWRDMSRLAAYS